MAVQIYRDMNRNLFYTMSETAIMIKLGDERDAVTQHGDIRK